MRVADCHCSFTDSLLHFGSSASHKYNPVLDNRVDEKKALTLMGRMSWKDRH